MRILTLIIFLAITTAASATVCETNCYTDSVGNQRCVTRCHH